MEGSGLPFAGSGCWPPRAYQAAVDGDALLGPLAGGPRPLQPLRAGQVHKVKLGSERLVLPRGSRAFGEPSRRVIHLQQQKATSDPGPWPARRCRRSAPPPPALPSAPDADAGTGAAHRAGLGAQARLAQVDGEDGVGARALQVHLGAGCGARQRPLPQALGQLGRQVSEDPLAGHAPATPWPRPRPRPATASLTSSCELTRREVTPVV